jgi:uncharacterized protein (TIGR03032 family)
MSTPAPPSQITSSEHWLNVKCSPHFLGWLAEHQVSLACSTYQTGNLLLIGRKPLGQLAVAQSNFQRCMGLHSDGQTLWLSSLFQICRLENILRPGELYRDHDRLYMPKTSWTTGNIDLHDITVEANGRVVFAASRFSCLASFNERYSFTPLWRPPFLKQLTADDSCHLNGVALESGRCRYVTAASTTDTVEGWRQRRRNGGVVLEVPDGQMLAEGLSMPHSPRCYRGNLWVLNSGTGFFGKIDRAKGCFEPVAFCPGYLRGLAFVGDYAIVGLSRPRHDPVLFGGLPLDDELKQRGLQAFCGLQVIDLRSGAPVHWLRIEGIVTELYDVVVLPGVRQPMAFGFNTDELERTIAVGDPGNL